MPSLEQRIATRLHQVLDHQERTRISPPTAERDMVIGGLQHVGDRIDRRRRRPLRAAVADIHH